MLYFDQLLLPHNEPIEMSKRIYSKILRRDRRELGYYVDELRETECDYYFFQIIALYIVPLFRQASSLEPFYFKYIKDKDVYLKERQEIESRVPSEIKRVFLSLKVDVQAVNLTGHEVVQGSLHTIEQVFQEKNKYRIPSYLDEACDQIRHLLALLVDMNQEDIVRKYAIVRHRHTNRHNPETGDPESMIESYVERYTFAPSVLRLSELNNFWDYHNVSDFWIALEYFFLIEWCWSIPFSFFADKTESYDDFQSRNEIVYLLSLYDYWIQVNNIKKYSDPNRIPSLVHRDVFLKLLKLILNQVILDQAVDTSLQEVSDTDELKPHNIKLRFDEIKSALLLDVRWYENDNINTYLVHNFQENSGPYSFLKAFMDAQIQEKIDLRKVSGSSGGTVAKYLVWTKMNGILSKLFFEEKTTHTVRVKAKDVYGSDLSIEDREALKNRIKAMKSYLVKSMIQ